MENTLKNKMREIKIFRNMTQISNNNGEVIMLHEDDMPVYNSWFLISYHDVDEVIFRGESEKINQDWLPLLEKIGNPKKVIVTKSTKDTY